MNLPYSVALNISLNDNYYVIQFLGKNFTAFYDETFFSFELSNFKIIIDTDGNKDIETDILKFIKCSELKNFQEIIISNIQIIN